MTPRREASSGTGVTTEKETGRGRPCQTTRQDMVTKKSNSETLRSVAVRLFGRSSEGLPGGRRLLLSKVYLVCMTCTLTHTVFYFKSNKRSVKEN